MLIVIVLDVSIFYSNAECHYTECLYAECHYTECLQAECHNAEYRDAFPE